MAEARVGMRANKVCMHLRCGRPHCQVDSQSDRRMLLGGATGRTNTLPQHEEELLHASCDKVQHLPKITLGNDVAAIGPPISTGLRKAWSTSAPRLRSASVSARMWSSSAIVLVLAETGHNSAILGRTWSRPTCGSCSITPRRELETTSHLASSSPCGRIRRSTLRHALAPPAALMGD